MNKNQKTQGNLPVIVITLKNNNHSGMKIKLLMYLPVGKKMTVKLASCLLKRNKIPCNNRERIHNGSHNTNS